MWIRHIIHIIYIHMCGRVHIHISRDKEGESTFLHVQTDEHTSRPIPVTCRLTPPHTGAAASVPADRSGSRARDRNPDQKVQGLWGFGVAATEPWSKLLRLGMLEFLWKSCIISNK